MTKPKLAPPPPEFTLTAINPYAAGVVRSWCILSQRNGVASLEEINEAYASADEMEAWHSKYGSGGLLSANKRES